MLRSVTCLQFHIYIYIVHYIDVLVCVCVHERAVFSLLSFFPIGLIADCLYLKRPLTRVIYHVNYLCQYIILIDEFVFILFLVSMNNNPFNQNQIEKFIFTQFCFLETFFRGAGYVYRYFR